MLTFFLRRLLSLPPLLLVISLMTYMLLQLSPGDFYAKLEQDQKYGFDYVMQLRTSVGRVVKVAEADRAKDIGSFTIADRVYSFSAEGALLKDGSPVDPKLEQAWVKRFRLPGDSSQLWSISERGNVYRWVGWTRGYVAWFGNVITGDLGTSWSHKAPVMDVMLERLWNTLKLEIVALIIAWGLAIPLGVWSGVRPNSLLDHLCGAVAYMSLSMPGVFLSLLALFLALSTGWFPVGDMHSLDHERMGFFAQLTDAGWHIILPASVIGFTSIAYYMRQMRGQMVEAMSSDYVRTARAKGVSARRVQFVHALRNAINPLVTMFGFSLAALLSGSFLVELIFNWPGLAVVTTNAVFAKDEPLVMASVLFSALLLVAGNMFADVLLAIVDPRIRAE
ncbi:MAG: ABC transporter permease [Planctomycetes bacterium]|nr:ABC transporter permease [Planctomycetota bacterium]